MKTAQGLTAACWYRDSAGGQVAVIAGIPGLDPRVFAGRSVVVDSRRYRVRAVETNAVPDATGRVFGLSVEEAAA